MFVPVRRRHHFHRSIVELGLPPRCTRRARKASDPLAFPSVRTRGANTTCLPRDLFLDRIVSRRGNRRSFFRVPIPWLLLRSPASARARQRRRIFWDQSGFRAKRPLSLTLDRDDVPSQPIESGDRTV